MSYYKKYKNGILVNVKLTPKSACDRLNKLHIDENNLMSLAIQVRAIPENNKANEALIKLIASIFKHTKSKVELLKGGKSRIKQIYIEGNFDELQNIAEQITNNLQS